MAEPTRVFIDGVPVDGVVVTSLDWDVVADDAPPWPALDGVTVVHGSVSFSASVPLRAFRRLRYVAGLSPSWQYPRSL